MAYPRFRAARLALVAAFGLGVFGGPVAAQSVIDDWNTIKAPPPPPLKPAKIDDPKTTALLVMDVNSQTCTAQPRPRCAASVPRLQKLVADGRAKGMTVLYTLSGTTTAADILKEIAPAPGDSVLPSFGPDKFMGNDLEKILKDRGIKTVIAVGTAAHTSVLHSASGAALRGYNVIVPVDAISSDSPYQEQYTVVHLTTASRVLDKVTLTATTMMTF
ncbi:MAG TPA: cysteine hydrolase [Alphaproteobacteria bacterium]|nr:cysteine hydrolase [Alphaproteobacteria bacterium]